MTRKREILFHIQNQVRDIYAAVQSIEQYVGELECIVNYERVNHVSMDTVLSTEPTPADPDEYLKREV